MEKQISGNLKFPGKNGDLTSYIPHAFTETELKNFFHACDNQLNEPLSRVPRYRRIIIPVLFRLLYSSGIRTCEARLLRVEDVDLNQGILNIRCSKGHGQHYVVLHDSMLDIMQQYDALIRKQYPARTYFFPAGGDAFHTRKWVERSFRRMWDKYNNTPATAYELRHHYATENINGWMDEGFGFDAKQLYLSKNMGHSKLESTRHYYSLVPGMTDILKDYTEEVFNSIVPEVDDESN